METTIETDVLIIGAGPTGLSLACQMLRYGINFVAVEKNAFLTPYSKAIGVHARTLEIFDQIGLAQEAVASGTIADRARLLIDGEIRGELEFSDIGKGLSPFPFVLMLEQSKTEHIFFTDISNSIRVMFCGKPNFRVFRKTRMASWLRSKRPTTKRRLSLPNMS